MQACCDKEREREGESRRGLSVIAAATAAHAIRSLSAPLSSSPRARRLRFHVPIYMYLIYNHAFLLYLRSDNDRTLGEDKIFTLSYTAWSLDRKKPLQKYLSIRSVQKKYRLNIRTPPMRSKTTIMSGLCPKNNSRWIVPTSPARSSRLLPNQLGVLA